VSFTFEILRRLRRALDPRGVPLIGFAGAPFTLAAYLVRGRGDPDRRYPELRALFESDPALADELMRRLGRLTADYLNAQIEAGAQVVQLFDSWCGILDEATYRRFVLPVTREIVAAVDTARAPFIHFASDAPHLVGAMLESGCDVLSVGSSVDLGEAAKLADAARACRGTSTRRSSRRRASASSPACARWRSRCGRRGLDREPRPRLPAGHARRGRARLHRRRAGARAVSAGASAVEVAVVARARRASRRRSSCARGAPRSPCSRRATPRAA